MNQSWCTFHDCSLWIVSWVNFHIYWGLYGHFHFWGQNMPPKTHICSYLPFPSTNTPGNRSTLMYLPWLDFVDSFLSEFSQLLRVLWAFSLFGVKMSQKEHICPYLPFTPTTTFRKQIYLDVLSMTGLSGSLPGWFSLIIKVTMGAFTFWRKKCPKNTYLSVSTLPDNKYNQKMDQSWWTFHDWTLWISSWVIFFH